jgi:hypothetical protein
MTGRGFGGISPGYDGLTGPGVAMECAHQPCTCHVPEPGEYCSEVCELGAMSGQFCGCEHATCETNRVRAPVFDS